MMKTFWRIFSFLFLVIQKKTPKTDFAKDAKSLILVAPENAESPWSELNKDYALTLISFN